MVRSMSLSAAAAPAPTNPPFAALAWTLVSLLGVLAWDALAQDRALARVFGTATGFPLREQWFLVSVLHEGARRAAWGVMLVLTIAVWWPFGVLRQISSADRLQLAITALLGVAVINVLKYASTTSCPWDLAEFGGVARYVSHWAWGAADGGVGRCFPAGHASAGFAFVGGFFALRRQQPRAARIWLACAVAAGLLLGMAQQARGVHFLSHTLWTGWLCWSTAWLTDVAARKLPRTASWADSTPPAQGEEPVKQQRVK